MNPAGFYVLLGGLHTVSMFLVFFAFIGSRFEFRNGPMLVTMAAYFGGSFWAIHDLTLGQEVLLLRAALILAVIFLADMLWPEKKDRFSVALARAITRLVTGKPAAAKESP